MAEGLGIHSIARALDLDANTVQDFAESMKGESKNLISKDEVIRITEIRLKARESADKEELVSLK